LLANKEDHKSFDEFVFQYEHARNYVDRREAAEFALTQPMDKKNVDLIRATLEDQSYRIRTTVLTGLLELDPPAELFARVRKIAESDPSKYAKAAALSLLATRKDDQYKALFVQCVEDSSYTVAGAAYQALLDLDEKEGLALLPKLQDDALGALKIAVQRAEFLTKTDADFDNIFATINSQSFGDKLRSYKNYMHYLERVDNPTNFEKGMQFALELRNQAAAWIPEISTYTGEQILELKKVKEKNKEDGKMVDQMQAQIEYLDGLIEKEGL